MPHGGQLGIPKPPVKLEYPMYLCNYDGQLGIGDDESKKFPTKFNMWMQSYGELGTNDHINHYIPVKLEGRRDKHIGDGKKCRYVIFYNLLDPGQLIINFLVSPL